MKADISKIINLMYRQGMNQVQLSAACGVPCATVNAIIKKRRNPSIATLGKIAGGLGCEPGDLLEV